MTARDLLGSLGLLAAAWAVFTNTGCMPRETAPCDALSLATLTAQCVARVAAECPPLPEPCAVEDECYEALDARQAECLARPAP